MTTQSPHHAVDADLPIPADKLDWMQQQLIKAGRLKEPIPLAKVTAPEIREKALKLAGK